MQHGKLQIPKLNIEPFAFVHDFQTRLFLQYANIVEKAEFGKSLVEMISNDSRVKALEGKMISLGSSACSFDVKTLTMWFLWCANEYGPESAEEYLNFFLNNSSVTVMNTLWVIGVQVTQPIKLDEGFEILPIENLPDSREKEMFIQDRFKHSMPSRTFPASAIIYPCKVNKTKKSDGFMDSDEDQEFWQASHRLYEIALLLNAIDGISCLPYFSTSYAYPTTPFGPFGGSGGGFSLYDVLGYSMSQLTPNDLPLINELIREYGKLPDSEKMRFRRILSRLSQAKLRNQIEEKILDLGITLEMLLLEDNKNNDQLSLSFRLRGSWLLGKTEKDRMVIYKQLRDIYSYRSQVAHTGILCSGDSSKIKKVQDLFPQYLSLAEQICRYMLKNGKPNWNEVVLGVKAS
jgi:hypothetical protein